MTYVPDQKKPVAPTSDHGYWGRFSVTGQLPNTAGASFQDTGVDYGDTAWSDESGALYVCTDPTAGAAVWVPSSGAGIAATLEVFVSQAGSDTTGTGTLANPYATISRALQDLPDLMIGRQTTFLVSVIPPYVGPGFSLRIGTTFTTFSSGEEYVEPGNIAITAYYDPAEAGVNDPRFSTVIGPVTTSAGTTFAGAAQYTVPTGSIPIANVHKVVRIFRGGSEVGRGVLAHVETGASDTVYINRTSSAMVPAAGDVLYVADLTVSLITPVTISGGGGLFSDCAFTVAMTGIDLAENFNWEFPLTATDGSVQLAMCTVGSFNSGSALVEQGGVLLSATSSFYTPWVAAAEGDLICDAGNALRGLLSIINGYAQLYGYVVESTLLVQGASGQLALVRTWHRNGCIYAFLDAVITMGSGSPAQSTVLLGGISAGLAEPAIDLNVADMGTTGATSMPFYIRSAGYANGQPIVRAKRARVGRPLQVNGYLGAVARTSPVVDVVSFSEVPVIAGTVTGPAGQDVRAGSTTAAYGGIPIVDAATLTRISSS